MVVLWASVGVGKRARPASVVARAAVAAADFLMGPSARRRRLGDGRRNLSVVARAAVVAVDLLMVAMRRLGDENLFVSWQLATGANAKQTRKIEGQYRNKGIIREHSFDLIWALPRELARRKRIIASRAVKARIDTRDISKQVYIIF